MIFLKHVEGSKRGQVEEFDLERIRVGRNPDHDLKFDPAADREVNGRRINQTTILRDGDAIQFAATGPKVIFSLGEAAHGTGTIVIDRDQIVASAASAAGPAAHAEARPAASPRRKTYVWAGAIVVLVLVIALLAVAAWRSWTLFFVLLGVVVLLALVGAA